MPIGLDWEGVHWPVSFFRGCSFAFLKTLKRYSTNSQQNHKCVNTVISDVGCHTINAAVERSEG